VEAACAQKHHVIKAPGATPAQITLHSNTQAFVGSLLLFALHSNGLTATRDSHEGRQGKKGECRGMQTYVVEVAHDRLVRRHGEGRGGVVLGGLAVKSGEHLRTSNRSGTTPCDSSEHRGFHNRKEL
jgi:hypothetical protein